MKNRFLHKGPALKSEASNLYGFIRKRLWGITVALLTAISIILLCAIFSGMRHELSSLTTVKSGEETEITLPVIMYHALIDEPSKQNKYFISPELFKADLEYLKEHGYTAITMTELINYVYNDAPLPEKPIVLTFDDGYYNNYYFAYPLLKEYGQKAVISIIGSQTDMFSLLKEENTYYSHVTWNHINEMMISGLVEIQNHTYDMHSYDKGRKGCTELRGEKYEDYKAALQDDIGQLQTKMYDYTGFTPNTMTYPYGYYSKDSEKVIKEMGFKASLTCSERLNRITKDPDCLYQLGRFLRPPGKSSEAFFDKILSD